MEVKSARSVFERLGKNISGQVRRTGHTNKVCSYWLAGKCTRNPCRFLHPTMPLPQSTKRAQLSVSRPSFKQVAHERANTWRRSPDGIVNSIRVSSTEGVKSESIFIKRSSVPPNNTPVPKTEGTKSYSGPVKQSSVTPTKPPGPTIEGVKFEAKSNTSESSLAKICKNWLSGTCVNGELCEYLHSWYCGNGFSMLAKLEGHTKAVTGITLPSGSDKLFTCGSDRAVRGWVCSTGECKILEVLSGEVGCLVSEGSCLYLGLENVVKVSDLKSGKQFTLTGPSGQVQVMIVDEDMLYAGTQDGTIWVWRFSPELNGVDRVATLNGHSQGISSLVLGGCNRLYSGSRDNTIRVWDLNSLQCIQTLQGHTRAVTSVLCWNNLLLSRSLDGTIKVWAQSTSGRIELVYTYEEDNGGCLALCGIEDADSKPILLCSREDNTVRLYDLPTFTERGQIFFKREVTSVQAGPQGLFFTGDATGQVTVWKLDGVFVLNKLGEH